MYILTKYSTRGIYYKNIFLGSSIYTFIFWCVGTSYVAYVLSISYPCLVCFMGCFWLLIGFVCCPRSQPTKSTTLQNYPRRRARSTSENALHPLVKFFLWLKTSVLLNRILFFVCFHVLYTPKIYHSPWKWWFQRLLSFWGPGAMLVYRSVGTSYPSAPATPFDLLAFTLNCEDLQWACDLNKDFVFAGDLILGSISLP